MVAWGTIFHCKDLWGLHEMLKIQHIHKENIEALGNLPVLKNATVGIPVTKSIY